MASSLLALFGGPAGAGKSTLAARWANGRRRGVHIQLDEVRSLIRGGLVDPQAPDDREQPLQYHVSVRASVALGRSFLEDGFDVAIDDVLEPEAFTRYWEPLLAGLPWRVVIIRPSLDETLARARSRRKRVHDHLVRTQHASTGAWPAGVILETTGLSVEASAALVEDRLAHRLPHA